MSVFIHSEFVLTTEKASTTEDTYNWRIGDGFQGHTTALIPSRTEIKIGLEEMNRATKHHQWSHAMFTRISCYHTTYTTSLQLMPIWLKKSEEAVLNRKVANVIRVHLHHTRRSHEVKFETRLFQVQAWKPAWGRIHPSLNHCYISILYIKSF